MSAPGQYTWDRRFMRLAREARTWVKGPDLGVGACVVSPDGRGFSLGYSGLPRGVDDTPERIESHRLKDHMMVHAELNAILNASRSLVGWTIYSTTHPCAHCAAAIIQAGIVRVVTVPSSPVSRWCESHRMAGTMLQEAGVDLVLIEEED